MPKVFDQYDKRGKQRVLSLKKTLYGLLQSSRDFWGYLIQNLIASGMIQSNLDHCLFSSDKFICIVYVDGLLFWSKGRLDTHNLAMKIRDIVVDI